MVFVFLLAKGDLRQWFAKLDPKNGVIDHTAVWEFVHSFCKRLNIEAPKAQIEDVLDHIPEFKFHEFVQLALLISRPLQDKKLLELDEELRADDEDSTSEAEDSDEEAVEVI
jgi:hypothetical protein